MVLNGCVPVTSCWAGTDARLVRLLALLVRGLEWADLEGCLLVCGVRPGGAVSRAALVWKLPLAVDLVLREIW